MKLVYHPEAIKDLERIAHYYAKIEASLSDDFRERFNQAIHGIQRMPIRYRQIDPSGCRKCILKRFPYSVIFRPQEERIRILSIKHHRQHPDFGMDRL